MNPVSALSVANAFVQLSKTQQIELTPMKLQKLIYLANGLCLAKSPNIPLITENFEVWEFGPVIADVYQAFKKFGNSQIEEFYNGYVFVLSKFEYVHIKDIILSEQQKKYINEAWDIGKKLDGIQLSKWSHAPDSPWTQAKTDNESIISRRKMTEYFTDFVK